jgi:hypothetical protein
MNLFDHTLGIAHPCIDKPRCATNEEAGAYLRDIAQRAGLPFAHDMALESLYGPRGEVIIRGAQFGGLSDVGAYCVAMPGYSRKPERVTCEILDEAGDVTRTINLPVDAKGKVAMKADEMQAVTGLQRVKRSRGRPAKVQPAPEPAASAAPAIAAPVMAPAPVAFAGDALPAILARLARVEVACGIAQRPKRSDAHAAAIRRAWAMRSTVRQSIAQRQAWFDRAKDAEMRLRDMETARDEIVADMERTEAARVAAVHRAECDASLRAAAEAERDEALALAGAEETARIGSDRALGTLRRSLAVAGARADRLARVAIGQRRKAVHKVADAEREVERIRADLFMSRAAERQARAKLDAMRQAVASSPMVSKIVERKIAA